MRLRWTDPAARDLTKICDYIGERGSPVAARRVAVSIFDSVSTLMEFPERGRVGRKVGTRELVLTDLPYVAIYRLKRDSIEILRILHGAQNWP